MATSQQRSAGTAKGDKSGSRSWLELPDGSTHPIEVKEFSIGRTPPKDLVLAHSYVSGTHARIVLREDGGHVIVDAGSTNGTLVDGRRIRAEHELHNGAKIKIGPFEVLYRAQVAGLNAEKTIAVTRELRPEPEAQTRQSVLIVESNGHSAQSLSHALRSEASFRLLGSLDNTRMVMRFLDRQPVDLVLLDLSLVDADGLALIRDLQSREQACKLFAVAGPEAPELLMRAVGLKVDGAAMKTDSVDELVICMKAVLAGGLSYSRRVSGLLGKGLAGTEEAGRRGGPPQLSDRELGVFHLIGAGRQNREIAEALSLSVKTVESHKENIKVKLNIMSTSDLYKAAKNWLQSPKG